MNTGQTPIQLLRHMAARNAAARQYAAEYERLAELHQMHVLVGNDEAANDAAWGARIAFNAWQGELDDRQPTE